MTTLVLVLKKIEREDKTKYKTFYSQKQLLMKVTLMIYYTLMIYTTIISNMKKCLGKGSGWMINNQKH